jgi:uncharacterized protein (DUF1501 family)
VNSLQRLQERRQLLTAFDSMRRKLDQSAQAGNLDRYQAQALDIITSARVRDAFDLSREPVPVRDRYGPTAFGRNCLLARRLLERGVRFVQVWSGMAGATGNWDNHADITKELSFIAGTMDKPAAALVKDLKARGMFEDTLIIWTTEFGRMPFSQGSTGRDHNGGTFVTWLAGAGIKAGTAYGESDEWSWKAVEPTYCYDLHSTILHLLGINHEKLTFRHNGIDRRLTDVHGEVINDLLA